MKRHHSITAAALLGFGLMPVAYSHPGPLGHAQSWADVFTHHVYSPASLIIVGGIALTIVGYQWRWR